MDTDDSACSDEVQVFTIFGEPASKANSRRLVLIQGKYRFIKSEKALKYIYQFKKQADNSNLTCWDCDVSVKMKIYYATRRPDLDESVVLDCLQGYTYVNDRQVKEKHIVWGLDKNRPRCEIEIRKLHGFSPQ